MNWYKLAQAYNREIGYLNQYLQNGYDPYDFTHYVPEYLEETGAEIPEHEEDYEIGEKWLEKATQQEKDSFIKWVQNTKSVGDDPFAPGYVHLDYSNFVKPTWMVHFTDDPWGIVQKGFIYGHAEYEGLGLTTWMKDEHRKKWPGYNFAFIEGERDARNAAREHKYGKHCVVFWSSGVKTVHYGDQEYQILFWGPAVDKSTIFPLIQDGNGDWACISPLDRRLFSAERFDDATGWIVNNHQMLANIFRKR